jgi:uncharacterized DUF497 family protein
MMLDFEWDEEKNIINKIKHGVDFPTAASVFLDPFSYDKEDRSMDYGEIRRKVTGFAAGRCLTVIYTERENRLRLVSARKATPRERFDYEQNHE